MVNFWVCTEQIQIKEHYLALLYAYIFLAVCELKNGDFILAQ
jgi:hypothetical protein